MAGDWIKMRHNLETDPDVLRIAEHVGVDRFSVVGRLHMIWTWADQHSIDGCAIRATTSFLDELVCCANFCDAMRNVGWLSGRDWALEFPNFDRHNGETAKKRASAKKTMQRTRNKSATNVAQNAQPEKRREEKSITLSPSRNAKDEFHSHLFTDPVLDRDDFRTAWERWVNYYNSQNDKPLNEIQALSMLEDFSRSGAEKAIADITFTIRKNCPRRILDSSNDFDKKQSATTGASKGRKLKSAKELLGGSDA